MHLAALTGNIRIASRLIKAGIDFTCKNKGGHTPLSIDAMYGYSELATLIQKHVIMEKERNEIAREGLLARWRSSLISTDWPQPDYTQHEFAFPKRRRHIRFVQDASDLVERPGEVSDEDGDVLFTPSPDMPGMPGMSRRLSDRCVDRDQHTDLAKLRKNEQRFWTSKSQNDDDRRTFFWQDPDERDDHEDDHDDNHDERDDAWENDDSNECPHLITGTWCAYDDDIAKEA